jgi:hypothetical protein
MNGKKQDSDDGALPLTQHQRTSSIHVFDAVHAYEEPVGPGAAKDKVSKWFRTHKSEWRRKTYTYTWLDWLAVFLPCLNWLRTYSVRLSKAKCARS